MNGCSVCCRNNSRAPGFSRPSVLLWHSPPFPIRSEDRVEIRVIRENALSRSGLITTNSAHVPADPLLLRNGQKQQLTDTRTKFAGKTFHIFLVGANGTQPGADLVILDSSEILHDPADILHGDVTSEITRVLPGKSEFNAFVSHALNECGRLLAEGFAMPTVSIPFVTTPSPH